MSPDDIHDWNELDGDQLRLLVKIHREKAKKETQLADRAQAILNKRDVLMLSREAELSIQRGTAKN